MKGRSQSKKISNDQELIQSDPTSRPQNQNGMNSSSPNGWSFSYLKFTKYVTNIIAEPKLKYGQQEQVTVRNHNRSTALERSELKYWVYQASKYEADVQDHT